MLLSLALATGLAGISHAASVDRVYAVSFNGSCYPPGAAPVNDIGNITGNVTGPVYLYAIDTVGGRVLQALCLDEPAYYMVVSPSGEQLYLTDGRSWNVTVVDAVDLTRKTVYTLNGTVSGIALSPGGSWLYATLPDRHVIYVINTVDGAVSAVIPVNVTPYDLAVSPDGSRIYVAGDRDGAVAVVEVPGGRQLATLQAGALPLGIAVSPDGNAVYVGSHNNSSIYVFDTTSYALKSVIVNVSRPSYLVTDVPRNWVFATSFSDGNLTRVDAALENVSTVLSTGASGLGRAAVSSDGLKIYVPDYGRRSLVTMSTMSLLSLDEINFADPVMALTVGIAIRDESNVTYTPTREPAITPKPTTYDPNRWGTPTPFLIPLPIPPKISVPPIEDNGFVSYRSWVPFFRPMTTGDVIFITIIYFIVLIVLAGITYIMMFRRKDDDDR